MNPTLYPTATEAELALFGACIVAGLDCTTRAIEIVPTSNLQHPDVARGFQVLGKMAADGKPVDLVSFAMAWKSEFGTLNIPTELIDAPNNVGSTDPAEYAQQINGCARRRQIIEAADRARTRAADLRIEPEAVAAELEESLSARVDSGVEILNNRGALTTFLTDAQRRFELDGRRSGIATGFRDLDEMTDGLQAGELAVIGARPSVGKSAILGDIVRRACMLDQVPTLLFSFEMGPAAIVRRLFCAQFNVPLREVKTGRLTKASFDKLEMFKQCLRDSPLHIVNALSGVNASRLCAITRSFARKHGVKLVVVDYLQRIPPAEKQEKRTYEVGHTSGLLKAVAVQCNISVLVAAQLSREPDKDKGRLPKLSDLADSAQIERDADLVGLLHRDRAADDGNAVLFVAKQRDGEVGPVNLRFEPQYARFSTL